MIIITSKFLTNLFTFGNADGVLLFPFVFLKEPHLATDEVFVNHERIHFYQALELLVIPFYIIYGLEFICKSIMYRSFELGYRNISFEREAYINQSNLNYLKKRKIFSFLKEFKK